MRLDLLWRDLVIGATKAIVSRQERSTYKLNAPEDRHSSNFPSSPPLSHRPLPWGSRRCVLYEMTALRHAFDGSNMRQLAMKICAQDPRPISSRCVESVWIATSVWAMLKSAFSACCSPFCRDACRFPAVAASGVVCSVLHWECFDWPWYRGGRVPVVAEHRWGMHHARFALFARLLSPALGRSLFKRASLYLPPALDLALVRLGGVLACSPSGHMYRLTTDLMVMSRYSSGMRILIQQLLKKDPHARPSTGAVLRQPLIKDKIGRFLSEAQASSDRGRRCLCMSSSRVSFTARRLRVFSCRVARPSSRAIIACFVARLLTCVPLAAAPSVAQTRSACSLQQLNGFGRGWSPPDG